MDSEKNLGEDLVILLAECASNVYQASTTEATAQFAKKFDTKLSVETTERVLKSSKCSLDDCEHDKWHRFWEGLREYSCKLGRSWTKVDEEVIFSEPEGFDESDGIGECLANRYKLQYGKYTVSSGGRHADKTILAFMGTYGHMGYLQDVAIFMPVGEMGVLLRTIIRQAVEIANEFKPDYICGHSLGGFIAECVCAETGYPGASFNAPGPWSPNPFHNYLNGNKYREAQFEVHLTRYDPVSNIGCILGSNMSHIKPPIWHGGSSHQIDKLTELLLEQSQNVQ